MARAPRDEQAARHELLALLAGELRRPDGPGEGLACALRLPPVLRGWLSVRAAGRRTLRVRCVSLGASRAFLASSGDLITAADLPAAARDVARAARGAATPAC